MTTKEYDKLFTIDNCLDCNITDFDICLDCPNYIPPEDVEFELDTCEECRLYGDDEYINSDGELVSRCFECFENPDNYDDGYYIGND